MNKYTLDRIDLILPIIIVIICIVPILLLTNENVELKEQIENLTNISDNIDVFVGGTHSAQFERALMLDIKYNESKNVCDTCGFNFEDMVCITKNNEFWIAFNNLIIE